MRVTRASSSGPTSDESDAVANTGTPDQDGLVTLDAPRFHLELESKPFESSNRTPFFPRTVFHFGGSREASIEKRHPNPNNAMAFVSSPPSGRKIEYRPKRRQQSNRKACFPARFSASFTFRDLEPRPKPPPVERKAAAFFHRPFWMDFLDFGPVRSGGKREGIPADARFHETGEDFLFSRRIEKTCSGNRLSPADSKPTRKPGFKAQAKSMFRSNRPNQERSSSIPQQRSSFRLDFISDPRASEFATTAFGEPRKKSRLRTPRPRNGRTRNRTDFFTSPFATNIQAIRTKNNLDRLSNFHLFSNPTRKSKFLLFIFEKLRGVNFFLAAPAIPILIGYPGSAAFHGGAVLLVRVRKRPCVGYRAAVEGGANGPAVRVEP